MAGEEQAEAAFVSLLLLLLLLPLPSNPFCSSIFHRPSTPIAVRAVTNSGYVCLLLAKRTEPRIVIAVAAVE